MIFKNKFGQTHYGINTYYWQYRFDKISNYISHSRYLKERFGSGFYLKAIRANAVKALEIRIAEVKEVIAKYRGNDPYIAEFEKILEFYEMRLTKIKTKEGEK